MAEVFDRLTAALSDRYAIERELGSGGMATVYLAEDLKHHRKVAVKVLRPELAAAVGADRFVREIEIAAGLTHPHILPLHDSGEADGFLYYVMPYIEGESLRDRLDREGKLSVADTIRITDHVASALSYAHERGVVHRDVKPENILLAGDQAIVADFGIARAVSVAGGERLTGTGLAVGTPAYMSPEQSMGQEDVDARSDVYALGCVVYEMVGGRAPFEGTSAQALLAKQVLDAVPGLRKDDPAIPLYVERAVERALAKSPEERFQSASTFAEALTTETVVARLGRRRLPWSVVWGVGAGALVAGTAVVLWQGQSGARADVPLDPNLAVVLPFAARGGGEELERLGEALPVLLEPWLTGEGAPRAASAVEVERAWQARLADGGGEAMSPAEARDLGRRLGAGQVWLGRLMAFPNEQVVINADVWQVADGERLAQAQVQGELDSLLVLINQLVRDLLPQQAGERRGAAELTTTSLPAQRAYLEGRRFLASGQWDAALTAFRRALERDSTFAVAAFYRSFATKATRLTGYGIPRADSLVCALRDRLGRRERLLLLCEGAETPWEHLERTREALRLAPDWGEAWYTFGDVLFHWGGLLGVRNAHDSAAAAFDRAIALADTARGEAVTPVQGGGTLGESYWVRHRIELAALVGDAATLRRLIGLAGPRGESMGGASTTALPRPPAYHEWLLAWADNDTIRGRALTDEIAEWLSRVSPPRRGAAITSLSQLNQSIPLDVVVQLVDSLQFGFVAWFWKYAAALNRGRPQEARAVAERSRREIGLSSAVVLLAGIVGEGDSATAAAAAREYEEWARLELAKAVPDPQARMVLCTAQLWRLHQGDFSTIERVERLVFDSVGRRQIGTDENARKCAYALSALAAHKLGRADEALIRVDSVTDHWFGAAALLVASIRSERQAYRSALATLRRRDLRWGSFFEAAFLRLEGDLARNLGDRQGAIDAYRRYLRLRSDPEPELIPERDQVRQALAELAGEPRRE
jgi:tetratricopeptide (TPR) repeat protein